MKIRKEWREKKPWVRGVNITISPEAHQKLKEKCARANTNIRALIDIHVDHIASDI